MTTDFSYGGQQIVSNGPFKPSGKDMPLDARTRINTYSEKETIPNPFVGMIVTVLTDENNNGEMRDYKVKSLKTDSVGIANMVIDEMIPYVDYLGVSAGGSSGEGLTSTQRQQLQIAYEHSQSSHVQASDLLNIDAVSLNGKKFSNPMTKVEYDAIENKDPNTIYLVDEDTSIIGVPDYSINDNNKVLAVNSDGTAIGWVDIATGSGSGLTTEQAQQLTTAYTHSQSEHFTTNNLITELNKLSLQIEGNTLQLTYNNTIISSVNMQTSGDNDNIVYGNIITSKQSIDINEGESTSFDIRLDAAPTNTQIIRLSVNSEYVTINPNVLNFNKDNYSNPQSIEITTIANPNQLNNEYVLSITSDNVSTVSINLNVNHTSTEENLNNLIVSKESIDVIEGRTAQFKVKLETQPSNDITVNISSDDESNTTVQNKSITFTSDNYNKDKTITVTGVTDSEYNNKPNKIILSGTGVNSKNIRVNKINATIIEPVTTIFNMDDFTLQDGISDYATKTSDGYFVFSNDGASNKYIEIKMTNTEKYNLLKTSTMYSTNVEILENTFNSNVEIRNAEHMAAIISRINSTNNIPLVNNTVAAFLSNSDETELYNRISKNYIFRIYLPAEEGSIKFKLSLTSFNGAYN